jgi:hypothetical protein
MTEKEKAGIITVRLGGTYVTKLDRLCQDTYRTRAKQLQALIDVGLLVSDLDQVLRPVAGIRAQTEAPEGESGA